LSNLPKASLKEESNHELLNSNINEQLVVATPYRMNKLIHSPIGTLKLLNFKLDLKVFEFFHRKSSNS